MSEPKRLAVMPFVEFIERTRPSYDKHDYFAVASGNTFVKYAWADKAAAIAYHAGLAGYVSEVVINANLSVFVNTNDSGYSADYAAGHAQGVIDGTAAGYTSGYADGDAAGQITGYAAGHAQGVIDGTAIGYATGFAAGLASVLVLNALNGRYPFLPDINTGLPVLDTGNIRAYVSIAGPGDTIDIAKTNATGTTPGSPADSKFGFRVISPTGHVVVVANIVGGRQLTGADWNGEVGNFIIEYYDTAQFQVQSTVPGSYVDAPLRAYDLTLTKNGVLIDTMHYTKQGLGGTCNKDVSGGPQDVDVMNIVYNTFMPGVAFAWNHITDNAGWPIGAHFDWNNGGHPFPAIWGHGDNTASPFGYGVLSGSASASLGGATLTNPADDPGATLYTHP